MSVFPQDLGTLRGPYAAPANILTVGLFPMKGYTGKTTNHPAIQLEVTLLDSTGKRMTPWSRVLTIVMGAGSVARLDGPWIRNELFTGSAPDGTLSIILSTCKSMNLPTLDLTTYRPPAIKHVVPLVGGPKQYALPAAPPPAPGAPKAGAKAFPKVAPDAHN